MTQLPDSFLVQQAINGDSAAFEQLVARFQRPLMAKALRRTRHLEDADDLVQETFLRAWRSLKECREPERFGGWLFRILANLTIDRGRISGRELPAGDDVGVDLADPRETPERALLDEELQQALERAMESIPEGRRREIFLLRFVEHLPIEAIAERLGVHSGTVKTQLHRSKEELKRRLGVRVPR